MTNRFAVYQPPVRKLANLKELAPNLTTLADVMKQNGEATGAFTGTARVRGGFGYEQGFDVYFHEKNTFGGLDRSIPEALAWLTANRDRKCFLILHGHEIHGQHTPPGAYDYRFADNGYDGKCTGCSQEQEALREEGLDKGQLTLRDQDVRFWRASEREQKLFAHFKSMGPGLRLRRWVIGLNPVYRSQDR